ncbi:MAG: hypothetical protein QHH04_08240 [Methanolinea sp.]|nr:hypothetical protein [Methanolinea sp.]
MNRFLSPCALVLALVLAGAGCIHAPAGKNDTADARHHVMQQLLQGVAGSIQQDLDKLDATVSLAAHNLGATGLSGPEVDGILRSIVSSHPCIHTAITYDANGTVRAAEPADVKVIIGSNLLDQENVQQAIATKEPLMSEYFALAEGGEAVSITHPVFSSNGEFLGAVSMTFSPSCLVAPYAGEAMGYAPVIVNVAQQDGRILYHPDRALIGKPTFNETTFASFPGVLALARRYADERSGYATFSFYRTGTDVVVEKEAFWDTVGLHGTEWRVMVIGER